MKKNFLILFFLTFFFSLFFVFTIQIFAAELPNPAADAKNWQTPQLQFQISDLKLSEPYTCGVDSIGRVMMCVNWVGDLISAWYDEGVKIVAILAVFSIAIGGVIWILAGGNLTKVETAKEWIYGAISGLILLMGSYLLLYIINPDLLVINPMRIGVIKPIILTDSGLGSGVDAGKAIGKQCLNGALDPSKLITSLGGVTEKQANAMSCIAYTESTCRPGVISNTYAAGLFQITRGTWNSIRNQLSNNCSTCTPDTRYPSVNDNSVCKEAFNTECNIEATKILFQKNKYKDWTCPGCNNKAAGCISKYDP